VTSKASAQLLLRSCDPLPAAPVPIEARESSEARAGMPPRRTSHADALAAPAQDHGGGHLQAALALDGAPHEVARAADVLRRHGLFVEPRGLCAPAPETDCVPIGGVVSQAQIDADAWLSPDASLLAFDRLVHTAEDQARMLGSPLRVVVEGAGESLTEAALGVATRYQRLWPQRNEASRQAVFDAVLRTHRGLHDCAKPLVRADFEHAVDVWQWVLRLCPEASAAVQIAALFHDIERLVAEPDVRVEQHAADYLQFKLRHAARGAELMASSLARVCPAPLVARAAELVHRHEQPQDDAELRVLNDADALSFFALNSAGFLSYFGPEHSAKKVAYTVRRISSARARTLLGTLRLEPFVTARLASELAHGAHAEH
jgi:hypothetical protein